MESQKQHEKIGGVAFLIGSIQFLVAITIAEMLNPGYDVLRRPVSDLGVGNFPIIFTMSIILYGIAGIIASFFIYKLVRDSHFSLALVIASFGTCFIGIFNESFGPLHIFSSGISLTFGAIATLIFSRHLSRPFSYYSVFTGLLSLAGLLLYVTGVYLGIGNGGMERIAIYPLIIWAGVVGSLMLAKSTAIKSI